MAHFTYQDTLATGELMQGDVLKRTEELDKLVNEASSCLSQDNNIRYFLVLTQSCDLVPRLRANGLTTCSANFITLSPVRDIEVAIKHFTAQRQHVDFFDSNPTPHLTGSLTQAEDRLGLPVCPLRSRGELERHLVRLFNNNEDEHFYLEKELDRGLTSDSFVYLPFKIMLNIDALQVCVESKILELTSEFRAKLGWLIGKIYSRVGTQDWNEASAHEKAKSLARDAAVWLVDKHYDKIRKRISAVKNNDVTFVLTNEKLEEMVLALPKKKKETIDEIMRIITAMGFSGDLAALRKDIEGSSVVSNALKE